MARPSSSSALALRVLQVVASTERRGAEVFALDLGRELEHRGHEVETVALSGPTPGGLPFRSLGAGRSHPRALWGLHRAMHANDITIVHGGAGLAPTALAAVTARRPYVYRNIGDPKFWGRVRFADLRVGLPLRRAAAVVALYRAAAEYMVEAYGLDRRKLAVASNAVDARRLRSRTVEQRASARAEFGVDDERPLVGYLGALSPEKRPEWAIHVAAAIEGASLVIAGDGPMRAELTALAGQRAPHRVTFLGSISEPLDLLDAIDVLVLPSRTEGVPGALIEAALVGVPVVATDVGGVGETLRGVGGGVAVPVDDLGSFISAVQDVLTNPDEVAADRARVVAEHDIGHVTDVWEATLRRALHLAPHGSADLQR